MVTARPRRTAPSVYARGVNDSLSDTNGNTEPNLPVGANGERKISPSPEDTQLTLATSISSNPKSMGGTTCVTETGMVETSESDGDFANGKRKNNGTSEAPKRPVRSRNGTRRQTPGVSPHCLQFSAVNGPAKIAF